MKKLLYLSVVALIYILFGIFYYWNPILLDQQDLIIEIGTQFDPYENVLNIVYGDTKIVVAETTYKPGEEPIPNQLF